MKKISKYFQKKVGRNGFTFLIVPNSSGGSVKSYVIPFSLALVIIVIIVFNTYVFMRYTTEIGEIYQLNRYIHNVGSDFREQIDFLNRAQFSINTFSNNIDIQIAQSQKLDNTNNEFLENLRQYKKSLFELSLFIREQKKKIDESQAELNTLRKEQNEKIAEANKTLEEIKKIQESKIKEGQKKVEELQAKYDRINNFIQINKQVIDYASALSQPKRMNPVLERIVWAIIGVCISFVITKVLKRLGKWIYKKFKLKKTKSNDSEQLSTKEIASSNGGQLKEEKGQSPRS